MSSVSTIDSPYIKDYKTPGTKNSQTSRRVKLLLELKQRRHSSIDEKRCISEVFIDETTENEALEEPMDTSEIKATKQKKYANKLMLSEWLIERPEDLEGNWLMKVCPKGVRNLIVAHKGRTKCFKNNGHFITQFHSQLPGGSPSSKPMKFTILDCIFSEEAGIYYVLDVLVWNSYSVQKATTDFRFFFLKSKLLESTVDEICKENSFKFEYIQERPAEYPAIEEEFSNFNGQIDGILFYHSELTYLSQVTPLVGWLKIFMIPEILSIPIHHDYYLEKPEDYTNLLNYSTQFQKRHKKSRKSGYRDVEMAEVNSRLTGVMDSDI